MSKMTFKDFLLEVDASDLYWAKSLGKEKKKKRFIDDNGSAEERLAPKKKKKAVPRRMIQDTRTSL